MSSPRPAASRSIVAALAAAFAVAGAVACAQGTSGADDDVVQPVDARRATDARIVDARPPTDANNSNIDARPPIDAGLPGLDSGLPGGSCTSNADCTNAGECCFGGLMCVPGMSTPLPPPFDCLPE